MDLVRIHVTPLGRGYIAESTAAEVTAMGATPEEAAENARRQAIASLYRAGASRPGTLIVRLSEPGRESIAMQSLQSAFTFRNSVRPPRDSVRTLRKPLRAN